MTIRIRTLSVAALVVLATVCSSGRVWAQAEPSAAEAKARAIKSSALAAQYAALPGGDTVVAKGETYIVLPDVRAVMAPKGQEPAGLTVMERKGRFVVYKETLSSMRSARMTTMQDSALAAPSAISHSVVRNIRTGNVGIVLGTITVKLADMSRVDEVASAQGLSIKARFDPLGLVYFAAAPGQDIAAATAALRADPRVTSADPEILEYPRVPN